MELAAPPVKYTFWISRGKNPTGQGKKKISPLRTQQRKAERSQHTDGRWVPRTNEICFSGKRKAGMEQIAKG